MIYRRTLKSLFRADNKSIRCMSHKAGSMKDNVTEQQISQLSDNIPLVDVNDKVVGSASKKDCHLRKGSGIEVGLLHRAFSVFLFNSKNELLLQQRSSSKVYKPISCIHSIFCYLRKS